MRAAFPSRLSGPEVIAFASASPSRRLPLRETIGSASRPRHAVARTHVVAQAVVMAVLLASEITLVQAQSVIPEYPPAVLEAERLVRTSDSFAAIQFVHRQGDDLTIAATYRQLLEALYWQDHDIEHLVGLGRAGIQFCLTQADTLTKADPARATRLLQTAQVMAYNVASYTWPGWAEKDVEITTSELHAGMDAARLNLRLVQTLEKGGDGPANARWMLGAHLLAAEKLPEARREFLLAAEEARRSGHRSLEQLCRGYASLTEIFFGEDAEKSQRLLTTIVTELRVGRGRDDIFFAEQLETARTVFFGRIGRPTSALAPANRTLVPLPSR